MKLLERNIEAVDKRLVLLAPAGAVVPDSFRNRETDGDRHRAFVLQMQQLRGSIYLRDGAVERRRLAPDGTHRTPEDAKSWHLLMLNTDRRVSACAWYLPHGTSVSIESLRVRNCPLAHTEGVRDNLRNAVESEILSARRDGIGYAEVGGWAVEKERTAEGLVLALAGYGLARVHGGTLGITTATVRHCSSTILRRLGGSSLQADGVDIPTYYDPTYRCSMELLRFDSRRPHPNYAPLIERLQHKLAEVLVIATPASALSPALEGASRRNGSSSLPPLAA